MPIHDPMFVRKPLRRKDKYPSFSAKTFGSDHALQLNGSEFSKGCFWARLSNERVENSQVRAAGNIPVADAVINLFCGKATWSRRRHCINGALETPSPKVCNWRIAAAGRMVTASLYVVGVCVDRIGMV